MGRNEWSAGPSTPSRMCARQHFTRFRRVRIPPHTGARCRKVASRLSWDLQEACAPRLRGGCSPSRLPCGPWVACKDQALLTSPDFSESAGRAHVTVSGRKEGQSSVCPTGAPPPPTAPVWGSHLCILAPSRLSFVPPGVPFFSLPVSHT